MERDGWNQLMNEWSLQRKDIWELWKWRNELIWGGWSHMASECIDGSMQ